MIKVVETFKHENIPWICPLWLLEDDWPEVKREPGGLAWRTQGRARPITAPHSIATLFCTLIIFWSLCTPDFLAASASRVNSLCIVLTIELLKGLSNIGLSTRCSIAQCKSDAMGSWRFAGPACVLASDYIKSRPIFRMTHSQDSHFQNKIETKDQRRSTLQR